MPGGVSPCGLEAGAPPDLVLIGPGFPCTCVTLPLELSLDCGSAGFDCAKTIVEAHKMKIAVRPVILWDMLRSKYGYLNFTNAISEVSQTGHSKVRRS
jgi:hypothetical protein